MSVGVQGQDRVSAAQARARVRRTAARSLSRALARSALTAIVTLIIVLALWLGVVYLSGVSTYVTKTPWDVWAFLFTEEDAAQNRAVLGGLLGVTLGHASLGFASGLVVAIIVAILFRLSKGFETAVMPFALLLRSVPLIALTPVIILMFKDPTVQVAVIGGIVVLFPALVNIAMGLKNSSPQMNDVVHVYGGSSFTAIRKVGLPGAVPSLFAAIRISVPGAVTGALLAEQLSVGGGVGSATMQFASQAKFADMWAAVVSITLISLLLYMLVQVVESVVLARMGMSGSSRD